MKPKRRKNKTESGRETASELRSRIMRAVRSKDTAPELAARRMLFALGYRYRLHASQLPGTPDLVFPSRKKVIFVHGCFWHGHGCARIRTVKKNADYWIGKVSTNQRRDSRDQRRLRALGWSVRTVWECEVSQEEKLRSKLVRYLGAPGIRNGLPPQTRKRN